MGEKLSLLITATYVFTVITSFVFSLFVCCLLVSRMFMSHQDLQVRPPWKRARKGAQRHEGAPYSLVHYQQSCTIVALTRYESNFLAAPTFSMRLQDLIRLNTGQRSKTTSNTCCLAVVHTFLQSSFQFQSIHSTFFNSEGETDSQCHLQYCNLPPV